MQALFILLCLFNIVFENFCTLFLQLLHLLATNVLILISLALFFVPNILDFWLDVLLKGARHHCIVDWL